MKAGVSAIERAFQLARSRSVRDVTELKRAIKREGYNSWDIEGKAITGQLCELIKATIRSSAGADMHD